MRQKRRNSADRAGLTLDIVEREIALGRRVKLQDLRNRKPRLKILPDIAAQAVAAGQTQPMLRLEFRRGGFQKIAAKLTDILEQRAVPTRHVAPEVAGRKFVGKNHGGARGQHAARRDHAADAVKQRQAIEQPIFWRSIGQPGEPAAPVQDAAVTDAGCFRQAGRAGGIDQQRTIIDSDARPLARIQRGRIHTGQCSRRSDWLAFPPCHQIFGARFRRGRTSSKAASSSCPTMT